MFLRVDKLQVELPAPLRQDPNAAAALQELLGGKYGEMSTLGNYMFQSFNFGTVICGRSPLARDLLTCVQGGRVQSYVRPVGAAHLTAGPDEIRRSGP
jgi:Mn-containing catalase